METPFEQAAQALRESPRFILISHIRPDGDAIGCSIALGMALRAAGKSVCVFNETGVPNLYGFLPGNDMVQPIPVVAPQNPGLIVALDTSTPERLGERFLTWNLPVDINIDHHVSNTRYGRINVVEEAAAAAQILEPIMRAANLFIGADAAANLFTALATDTGSFRFRGVSAKTFALAERLTRAGADPAHLATLCFSSMSRPRFDLQRMAFSELRLEQNDKLAHLTITPEHLVRVGANAEETEGLVNLAQHLASVEVSALFELRDPDLLKVSLRSRGTIDVNKVATAFGGGGHPSAAGIQFPSLAQENRACVLSTLRDLFA